MKKLLAVLLVGLAAVSCGGNKKARISGMFAGLGGDTVYLELTTAQERKIVDSTVIDDKGGFGFKTELPSQSPTFYNLICQNSTIPLLVSLGEHITVNSMSNLARNYEVAGSRGSELIKEFHAGFYTDMGRLDSLSYAYSSLPPSPVYDRPREELLREYTDEFLKFKRKNIAYVVKNASSMASIYALYQTMSNNQPLFNINNDIGYYRMLYDSLSAAYPESGHVLALKRDIDEQNRVLTLVNDAKLEETHSYPDIVMNDMYGKSQSLYSLDGKVVLLDFWISTNDACKIYNAELKEIYAEYEPKGFAIYQVSMDTSRPDWVLSVQNQKLPWITVCDFRGGDGPVAMSYGIRAVPANILIDRNGNVAGQDLYGDALKAKLAQLMR